QMARRLPSNRPAKTPPLRTAQPPGRVRQTRRQIRQLICPAARVPPIRVGDCQWSVKFQKVDTQRSFVLASVARPLQDVPHVRKFVEPLGRSVMNIHAHPKRILLIEDDRCVADVLQNALERSGYSVKTADRVQLGLAAASEQEFDAVVTDVQLPDGKDGGLRILATLHSSQPHLPVILIT